MKKALEANQMVSIKPPVKVLCRKTGAFLCSKGHTLPGAGVSFLEWRMHPYYRARLKGSEDDAIIVTACLVFYVSLAAAIAITKTIFKG